MTRFLSRILGAGFVLVGILIVTAPPQEFWGERHTPHLHIPPLPLSSEHTVSQTFRLERDAVNLVLVWVDRSDQELPKSGGLSLTVQVPGASRERRIDFRDVPESGVVPFDIDPPLASQTGTEGILQIRLTEPRQHIFLQYQKAAGIYPDGTLFLDGKKEQGDLAFQARYLRPALGTRRAHWGYAAAVAVVGLALARMLRSSGVPQGAIRLRPWALAVAIGALVSLYYGWFLLRPGEYWVGASDFSKDAAYVATGADATRHGAWPVWSHRTCGGMAALGNPEGNTISLGTLLALALPPDRALLALLTLEAGLGAAGAVVLGRMLGLSPVASICAAVISLLSASFAYRIGEGLTPVGSAVAFLPWVFAALIRALQTSWGTPTDREAILRGPQSSGMWTATVGTLLAAMFLRGDVHVVVGVAFAAAVWCLVAALGRRSWRPLLILTGVGAVFFLWGSIKMLPYLEQPSLVGGELSPYVVPFVRTQLLDDVFFALHDRTFTARPLHDKRPETWGNFGMYVGILPLVLGAVGLLTKHPFRIPIALTALTAFLLSEGTAFETVLRHVSPLDVLLRVPSRLWSIFTLFLGLLAGIGIDRLARDFPRVAARIVLGVVTLFLVVDLGRATATVLLRNTAWDSHPPVFRPDGATLMPHANTSPSHERHATKLLRAGFLLPQICGDQNNPPKFIEQLKEPAPLATVPSEIRPNRILLSAPEGPADVVVRERFTTSWASDDATIIENNDGALHLVFPRGSARTSELTYRGALTRAEQVLFLVLLLTLTSFVPALRSKPFS